MRETGNRLAIGKADRRMIDKVLSALCEIYRNDYFLIENNCHELSITGAFYRYFRNNFDRWVAEKFHDVNIDMEYGKMGEELCAKPAPLNNVGKRHMRIDFVIHKRGIQTQNILAIEFKLKNRKKDIEWDYEKLKSITIKSDNENQVRNYILGISIVLDKKKVSMKYFKDGAECSREECCYVWNGEELVKKADQFRL